jgi:predicted DNA-binding transcriptional regulator YafY
VLETSARLLEMLTLLQMRREWSAGELAERLQVGTRTIRRDVQKLRLLGYPIDATPGVAGGYRLGRGASLPPLMLDQDEAIAVAVGLRGAAGAGVSGIEETSVRALAKLEQLLPSPARRRVGALASAMASYPGVGPLVDAGVLAAAASAARDSQRVRFRYRDREGEQSRRVVEPHRLVHTGRRWYLVAWDCGRADWRTFRVDRIVPPLAGDRRFAPREPPARDIAKYVARSISVVRDRHQAEIVLHAPIEQAATRVPRAVGTLEAIDEHTCLLRTGADWLGGLAVYVADIGFDFEVRDPPELAERVRELAERFARATR